MSAHRYALDPEQFLGAINASRDTLGKARMKLLDIVRQVRDLTDDAPYAVVGSLAQILWARKTHTDDLNVALAGAELDKADTRVSAGAGANGWSLPTPPDLPREEDEFEICHLLYRGSVVDLIAFKNEAFTHEIVETARIASELDAIRFIGPKLLLVCHLLRPTVEAKLAAVELYLSRRAKSDFDTAYARHWAGHVGATKAFGRILDLADKFAEE